VENRGRQNDRGKGLGNHANYRKGISKSKLGKIKCWNCGKKGHLKKDYKAPKKQRDGGEIIKMGVYFSCFVRKKPIFSQVLQLPVYKSIFFI
jgi:hypothetical protein